MAATLTIVNQHGQTLAAHRLGNTPLSIRAQDQVQYQLAGEGGLAPANVEAARAGNDLLVNIDGQQALRIEDYFLLDENGLKNPLLGMNDSGQYVAYGIVEAPSVLPVEHVLAEEVAGVAASEGASVSALTAFGIGTLALGGLALAAQSSNENNDQSNQPAPPPADNGNTTPPPSGGGNTTPPPSGGGTNPPPSGGGNTNPPPQLPKPNGSITIEGDAKVGQTLTANITDADGVSGSPKYQWLADGQPIQGATQSTYTLTANEKGKAISVQATYTDGQNTPEKPSSAATAPVIEDTPAPPPPAADTTAPTLAISATPSTLTPGSSTQLTFKASEPVKGFTADDVIVQGGTLSNFRQVDAKTFTVTFTAGAAGKASITVADDAFVDLANNSNELANLELVIGAAPTPPMPKNHAPSDITLSANGLPENKSGAIVGKLATVDPDVNDSHTYAVNDNRFEVDAQGNLKLKDGVKVEFAQEKTINLQITTNDGKGGSYREDFTLQVQDDPAYPAPQPTPNQAPTDITLSATTLPENKSGAIIGKLATVDPDANDSHTYAVNDQRFEVDAQGNLKLKDGVKVEFAQEPQIRLTITTNDGKDGSYSERFTLNVQDDPNYPAPTPPAPTPPAPNGTVRISGEAKVGGLLTAQVEDADGFLPENIEYQWYADGIPIANALEQTYRPTTDDQGKALTVRASYIDNADQDESPLSAETAPVADAGNDGKLGVYVPKPATDFIANVKDAAYGAKGDGQTDDTAAIQKAIDAVAEKGGGIVDIPAGTYMINGATTSVLGPGDVPRTSGLQVKSNVIIRMADDTVMQVIPNGEKHYDIFNIYNAENVAIMGGTLRGDRHSHLNDQGEWGSGIKIASAKNVVIEKVIAREFWGDAVHISDSGSLPRTPSENVTVYQLTADGNRRQGISITSADKVLIEDSAFKNTGGQGGTPPMAGIDIEPESQQQVSNVTIKNSTFDNNTGYGIALLERADVENADIRNIVIDGNTIKTGGAGIVVNNTGGHTITNNHISDIGKGWYYGSQHSLALNANSHDNTVTGNTVKTGSIIDAGQNNSVSGNTFESVAFVRGENKVGATLTAEVHNDDGAPRNLGYQWLADGKPINGATAATYTVRPEDAGKRISVEASFDKDGGTRETTEYEVPTLPIEGTPNPPTNDGKLGVHVPKPITDFIANAKEFGAKGDGQTDDTAAIQKAIDAVAEKGGGIVNIPAGTYMVDAERGIDLKSNVIVRMADHTVLKVKPNAAASYEIFHIHNVENAHILGGTLEGDRSAHTGTGGEWGMGIRVTAAQNVVIEGVTVREMWGDGIYLGKAANYVNQNENIVIYGVSMDHNRRQGLTVTQRQGVKILNSVFQNTDGTKPAAGIDLEPNAGESVRDVEIRDNTFSNNRLGFLVGNDKEPNVYIKNIVFEHNILRGNTVDGIRLHGLEGGSIRYNTIHIADGAHPRDPGGIRLYNGELRPTTDVDVSHNTLYGGVIQNRQTHGNTIADNLYKAAVFIRGEAEVGQTLTAAVYDGDIPPQDGIRYRWFAGNKEIANADGQTYTVRPQDAGKAIRVQVDFTDGAGQSESAQSAHTPTVPGTYTPPADGKLGVYVPKPVTDFVANAKDVAYGATGAEYQIRPADNGKILGVRATFTNAAGNTEHAESLPGIAVGGEQPNRRPTDIRVDGNELMENRPGAIIGKVQVIDPDKEDSYTYKFFDPRFEVKDGYLKLKDGKSVSLANEKSIEIVFAAFDKGGVSHLEYHTVKVLDDPDYESEANRAPTDITLSNTSVMENRPGAIVGKIDTLDPDLGDGHRYNLSVGKFTVQDGYLKLHPSQSLEYSTDRITILNITSTDDLGAKISKTFRIDVQDDPDYPAPAALAEQTAPATTGTEKSAAVAKPLTLRLEPELNLDNLERGSDAQDRFTLDGQGVKTIVDFNISDGDLLQLESDAFTALDKGTLAETAFTVGDKAGNAEHRVVYNASTGELAYDPDGSGTAASTIIARLDPALELEAQHIQII